MSQFSQARFMQLLAEHIPDNLPAWLAEELKINRSSAYRKSIGQTRLSAEELVLLIEKQPEMLTKIFSFYQLQGQHLTRTLCFKNQSEFQDYLRFIKRTFRAILEEGQKLKLYYRAQTLPLFLFLSDQEVLKYKLAYWTDRLYTHGCEELEPLTWQLAQDVYGLYRRTPSDELWHVDAANLQERLIAYHKKEAYLDAPQAYDLQARLKAIGERVSLWEQRKEKQEGATFRRRYTEVEALQNAGLLKHNGHELFMGAFDLSHFMATADPQVCARFRRRWERLW